MSQVKIERISVYQVDLPLHEGTYSWSEGKSVDVFDSTVVQIETDAGITGYGEVLSVGASLSTGLCTRRAGWTRGVGAGSDWR